MNVAPVISRLQSQVPTLLQVGGAVTLDRALAAITTFPAAFVIPLAEQAKPDETDMMNCIDQSVDALFGVVLAMQNLQDTSGEAAQNELETLRLAVREALLGWAPAVGYAECTVSGGQILGSKDQAVYWQDDFLTSFQIRK